MAHPARNRPDRDRPRPGKPASRTIARTALVTGASRGLGLLIAGELARHGCRVTLCAPRGGPPPSHGDHAVRWSNRWMAALNAFDITFDGRLSAGRA
ncbi:SDR family NAD(P)-dependent oxidoreductase [Kitasatospora sp. NPDC091335]|uniref:SDR family NAD(P)-dependent oxidoreductase n=1 Tax=Kitasatospora sp. NPDC091335 TaxID=3364085 RepID=UPI0037FD444F